MRFPNINDVAAELRNINKNTDPEPDGDDGGVDVRLQVYPDGQWAVRWGSSDYDQDHRGYWGSSSVPGGNRRFDSKDIARDLIDQAREQKATGGEGLEETPAREVRAARGGTNTDAKNFREVLEKGVILVAGEVVDNNSIDLDSDERVTIAIIMDVNGFGPHVAAIAASQGGHPDAALEVADELLEEWTHDHYPDANTETFDGLTWELTPHEFDAAIEGTKADEFFADDIYEEGDEDDDGDDDGDPEQYEDD